MHKVCIQLATGIYYFLTKLANTQKRTTQKKKQRFREAIAFILHSFELISETLKNHITAIITCYKTEKHLYSTYVHCFRLSCNECIQRDSYEYNTKKNNNSKNNQKQHRSSAKILYQSSEKRK